MYDRLFEPLKICNTTLKNRFCFPAVGLKQDADPVTGCPGSHRADHYIELAKGGAGLVVVGITSVQKDARLRLGQFGLWDDCQIDGFRKMTDAMHRYSTVVMVQLHHAGARVLPQVCAERVTPSPIKELGTRSMTLNEIERLRGDYIAAAVRAQKAGFDGVELHAAHGYLLSLFASPLYNRRSDAYGGPLENRLRLQTEIIGGIRTACGDDFIIASRIGGNEPDFEQGIEIAKQLESAGADYLSVSFGMDAHYNLTTPYWLPTPWPEGFRGNSVVYAASLIRQHVKIPIVAVRSIYSAEAGEWLLQNGHADIIAYARPMLTNPDFVNRIQGKIEPATECLDCAKCGWFSEPHTCPIEKKHQRDFYGSSDI